MCITAVYTKNKPSDSGKETTLEISDLSNCEALLLARTVASVLVEKNALDIRIYSVKNESSVTDYYVNATGRSSAHVSSLADDVAEKTELAQRSPLRIEGRGGNSWLLVDYGDVIVNIFDKQSREFYNFDRLMPESGRIDMLDIIKSVDEKLGIRSES